jgi:hypothetical protein
VFPAVWIAREGSFDVVDEPLTVCNYRALTTAFFSNLVYFDSAGLLWEVDRAEPEQPLSWRAKLFNLQFRVRLAFARPIRREPSDVAEVLCTCVDADPDDLYSQFVSHEELKSRFRGARSARELIEVARTLGRE